MHLSVWRPLFGPLGDWPLGLLDSSSLDPEADLVPSDNVYTHLVTETYNVFYQKYHRWYYLEDMMPKELLVFKSYDSGSAKNISKGASPEFDALPVF